MEKVLNPFVWEWFKARFPGGPTSAQEIAIPHIAKSKNTLISSPTGSGKTLAAFLVAISQLCDEKLQQNKLPQNQLANNLAGTSVVYVSPLKALANDIRENLIAPLSEIETKLPAKIQLSVGIRTGDTSQSARAAMLKHPPDILVTTPESLYLLVTAAKSREILQNVKTVIVDEIHALARDKRGSHLSLSLERLAHISLKPITRIGLSATQKPIQTLAEFLVGTNTEQKNCQIVDTGIQREMNIAIELPPGDLEAVAPLNQLDATVTRLAELITSHGTTLIFVNTRRMTERIAHLLGQKLEHYNPNGGQAPTEKLSEKQVVAHHGSLSLARRERVEARLRAGELKALVATASLELGIDVGPVDLVCQIGSPRSFATFLQRVGRANHGVGGIPKGRLFPSTRDELLESNAILSGIANGQVDAVHPPIAPLDILAQHLTAECSAKAWDIDELFSLVKGAWPYKDLSRTEFMETLNFVSDGIQTARGQRGAHVHLDRINHRAEGRRGARMMAIRSGGAIPDTADYRVLAEPEETYLGTVHEDFAVESMAGDVFLLGSHPWRILRVSSGTVYVQDAAGMNPTIPFWLGEAQARTVELSDEVAEHNARILNHLESSNHPKSQDGTDTSHIEAEKYLIQSCGIQPAAASQSVNYLVSAFNALGKLPTRQNIIVERFFDQTGGAQLILHSLNGGRINKALGLALRKRFCRTFDFELQAAANDNTVLISLGPHHSFPLSDVVKFLNSKTVIEVLKQAVLQTPLFTARWRWNLNRALIVSRYRGSGRNPPQIQRMEADDLMAAIFPQLAACQDNTAGPIEIPDHLLVRQTIEDVLTEALDAKGLKTLIEKIENDEIEVHTVETVEPSPLAHEIINGRPYTFLDDAPLEERRSQAVGLNAGSTNGISQISIVTPDAIAQVQSEVAPDPRSANELYDLLMSLVVFSPRHTSPEMNQHYSELENSGRVKTLLKNNGTQYWCAVEMQENAQKLFWGEPDPQVLLQAVRGHLEISGPISEKDLTSLINIPIRETQINSALCALENEGFAIRGSWPQGSLQKWCSRRLLARIHAYSKKQRRAKVAAISPQDFMKFLLRWQHVQPDYQTRGIDGLASVIFQLQGLEIPAASWEADILPSRVANYSPAWLDQLCHSGEISWGRISKLRSDKYHKPNVATTNRNTPISIFGRTDLDWLIAVICHSDNTINGNKSTADIANVPATGVSAEIYEILKDEGAQFFYELVQKTGRLPSDVERGLWDGVSRGFLTADSFGALRSLFFARKLAKAPAYKRRRHRIRHQNIAHKLQGQYNPSDRRNYGETGNVENRSLMGRWALLAPKLEPGENNAGEQLDPDGLEPDGLDPDGLDPDELAEEWAYQLLERWGVIFYDLATRENHYLPWRNIIHSLRRLEARGVILGGRFINGFSGEQYALPEAVEDLHQKHDSHPVTISSVDPLNLTGIIFKDQRIPASSNRTILLVDGIPQSVDSVNSTSIHI